MQASPFVLAVLFLFLLFGPLMMFTFRGVKGVMVTIVIGWLFLPPVRGINLPGLPMFTKEYAVAYALFIGVILSNSAGIMKLRPKLIDLPVLIFILAPLPTSITNGLGVYDGLSGIYSNIFLFGVPYFLGRIYIRNPNDVKVVAIWFILAGFIAVPMALWESQMSPQLNRQIYGYHASAFHMTARLGGYRPVLFMRHGLEVGLWFATSGAVAMWIWLVAAKQTKILNFPVAIFSAIVLSTTILSRSLGAIILLAGTAAIALFVRSTGFRLALAALVLTPSVYLSVRISNIWSPDVILNVIESYDPERANSLKGRVAQEVSYSQHALKKPLFGWGGYNRFRPVGVEDRSDRAVDGFTTIIFGVYGLVGLVSFLIMTALPSLLVIYRIKRQELTSALWAPAIGIILGLGIFSIDMLLNSFYTPLHIIGIGVIASVAVQIKQWQRTIRIHRQQSKASIPPTTPTTPTTPIESPSQSQTLHLRYTP